ncbi:hypothetical protein [Lacticaseibacillus sp. GG6-2]
MKRKVWLIPVLTLAMLLAGCKQHDATAASSSSKAKTVITSKQYTTTQLQKRYTTIVDAVVKPLNLASYSQPPAKIKQAADAGIHTVEQVKLQLASNTSQPAATKAIQQLATAATTMLTAINGTDQKAYNADAKTFMTQTSNIAKTYFNGNMPLSLTTYSQRMANRTTTTSSTN